MAFQSIFYEFSNEEIERLLKNSVPAKTKKATSFGMIRTSMFLRNDLKKSKFSVHTFYGDQSFPLSFSSIQFLLENGSGKL